MVVVELTRVETVVAVAELSSLSLRIICVRGDFVCRVVGDGTGLLVVEVLVVAVVVWGVFVVISILLMVVV